jgi:uncharacterized protein YraI
VVSYLHRTMWAALGVSVLLLAACGGPPGLAQPTPLPPQVRPDQPTPVYPTLTPAPPAPTLTPVPEGEGNGVGNRAGAEVASPEPTATPAEGNSPADLARVADLAAAAALANQPTGLAIVGSGGAALRDGPGGSVQRTLNTGAAVTVTGKSTDGRWLAVFLDNGVPGWLDMGSVTLFGSEDLPVVTRAIGAQVLATMIAEASQPIVLTPLPTPAAEAVAAVSSAPDSPEQPQDGLAVVVDVDRLNVRAGPGTDYLVVGRVVREERLRATARNAATDWLLVEFPAAPAGFGWVYAPMVVAAGDPAQLPISDRTGAAPAVESVVPAAAAADTATGLSGRLVFQARSGGEITVYDLASGALQPLTFGGDPAFSPDGSAVAFVRSGAENGLYLVDVDEQGRGRNERLIFGANAPRAPKWSPDGRHIVFSHIVGASDPCRQTLMFGCVPQETVDELIDELFGGEVPEGFDLDRWPLVQFSLYNLSRVDFNGENYRDVPALRSAMAPDWHSAGIVYQSKDGLQITEDVLNARTRPVLPEYYFQDPDWQPDGGRIAYQSQEGNHWEIFLTNPDGSGVTALTRPPLLAEVQPQNVSPAWSPDGRHIVFVSNRSGRWALWVMEADGSNQRPLPIDVAMEYTFNAEQMVDWGP